MPKKKLLTQDEVVRILHAATVISSQSQVAANIGVSKQALGDVLHGRHNISDDMATRLGYRRVVLFEEISTEES